MPVHPDEEAPRRLACGLSVFSQTSDDKSEGLDTVRVSWLTGR
jgi:hypothetical protein